MAELGRTGKEEGGGELHTERYEGANEGEAEGKLEEGKTERGRSNHT